MTVSEGRDPHALEEQLEKVEEYQAPPRPDDAESDAEAIPPDDGARVDINLLESQQGPGAQASASVANGPGERAYTVSTQDEESDPKNPRAVPPGETM